MCQWSGRFLILALHLFLGRHLWVGFLHPVREKTLVSEAMAPHLLKLRPGGARVCHGAYAMVPASTAHEGRRSAREDSITHRKVLGSPVDVAETPQPQGLRSRERLASLVLPLPFLTSR